MGLFCFRLICFIPPHIAVVSFACIARVSSSLHDFEWDGRIVKAESSAVFSRNGGEADKISADPEVKNAIAHDADNSLRNDISYSG